MSLFFISLKQKKRLTYLLILCICVYVIDQTCGKYIDVWIDAGHLMIIAESTKCNVNEMIRKLLIFLIGEKQLSRMSALGQGGKPAIYPKVYTAVKG